MSAFFSVLGSMAWGYFVGEHFMQARQMPFNEGVALALVGVSAFVLLGRIVREMESR